MMQPKFSKRYSESVDQREHRFLGVVRLIKDLLSLRSRERIYFSYYAVFFKLPLDISYVHQNLQLMSSVTYPVFLRSR